MHVGEWGQSAKSGKGIPPTVHHSKRDRTTLRVTTSSHGEPRQFAEGDVPDPAFLLFRVQSHRGDVEGDVRLDDGLRQVHEAPVTNKGGLMSRSSSAAERGPGRVSGGSVPLGALISAGPTEADRLRVVEGSDHSPKDETPPIIDLRLVLVTASGFEVPLVASPAQAVRLLRSSGGTDATDQRGDGDPGAPRVRGARRPCPVPVDQLLSRGRLVSRFETPLGVVRHERSFVFQTAPERGRAPGGNDA